MQIAYYGSLGIDYHSIDFRRPELRPKRERPVPINRIVVKKIAPPKKTKDVANVYETGDFCDLHYAVKHDLSKEKVPEHGVYENQPGVREGVYRETDYAQDEFIEPGTLGALINDWKMKGKQTLLGARKTPIAIDKNNTGPELLENEPIELEGVVRERDSNESALKPQEGTAKNLLDVWVNASDTVSVERKPITLVEDPSAPTVFESEPTVREGVIRNTDKIEDATLEQGGAKGLVGYWKTVTDDVNVERRPVNVREGKEIVLESQPIVREGVVRETDKGEDLSAQLLAEKKAKMLKEAYLEAQRLAAEHKGKAVVLDLAQDGGVLENEPSVRTDVVKSDVTLEDFVPKEKHTKKLLNRYMEIAASDQWGGSRGPIEIDRSGGIICENEPAALADGIIRGGGAGHGEVNFEEGKTRSMVDQWRNKGDAEFKRHFEGKPKWVQEIEQAQEAGVYENEPTVREGVLREADVYQPVGFSVPTEITKGMKDMWLNREAYEEERLRQMRENKPEVRPKKKLFDAWIPDAGGEEEEEEEETPAPQTNGPVNGEAAPAKSGKKSTTIAANKKKEPEKKKSSDAASKKTAASDSKDKASPKKKATSVKDTTKAKTPEKDKAKAKTKWLPNLCCAARWWSRRCPNIVVISEARLGTRREKANFQCRYILGNLKE